MRRGAGLAIGGFAAAAGAAEAEDAAAVAAFDEGDGDGAAAAMTIGGLPAYKHVSLFMMMVWKNCSKGRGVTVAGWSFRDRFGVSTIAMFFTSIFVTCA